MSDFVMVYIRTGCKIKGGGGGSWRSRVICLHGCVGCYRLGSYVLLV